MYAVFCEQFTHQAWLGHHIIADGLTAGDQYKLALYTPAASLDQSTDVYTTEGELVSANYTAGGIDVALLQTTNPSVRATFLTFPPVTWSGISGAVEYALLYNATQGNRVVGLVVMQGAYSGTNILSNTVFQFDPGQDASTAMLVSTWGA